MTFDDLLPRLRALDTTCLSDANKSIRVLDPAIRPIRRGLQMIGRAYTVTCRDDFLTVILALRDARPGDVLVVDGQGGSRALAGELFATEAHRKGLAGLVVDGAVRDTATLETLPIPVYARSICPVAGTTTRLFSVQVPVTCGGAVVHPGDIVFGDSAGVIVASVEELAALVPVAEGVQAAEAAVLASLRAGRSLMDMLNLDAHLAAVAERRPSRLQFLV